VVGRAITALSPTVSGQVTSYSADQALPAGLSLNTSTGVISGTPTTVTAQATYTVHAQNSAGTTSATVALVVDTPPSLGYSSPTYSFTANVGAQAIAPQPSSNLGSGVAWSVSPTLPAGLTLDATNGTITGTPTAASAASSYTVSAAYSGGSATAALTISVAAAPLLDLGLTDQVVLIRPTSTRVLSLDVKGHWLLQDFTSGSTLARGDNACGAGMFCTSSADGKFAQLPVDLAGSVMIDSTPAAIEIRSLTDGHVLGTIPTPISWFALASDGSYISTGSATALSAWSASGQLLFARQGDYSTAVAFAAPGEVRVAVGPAGSHVIETVAVPTGTSASGPAFQGQFQTWFRDGGNFLTSLGNTVWTYSAASAQQDITQLPAGATRSLNGWGQFFWSYAVGVPQLSLYKVGASTSAALTGGGSGVIPSGSTIAFISQGAYNSSLTVVDLSGSAPASTVYHPTMPHTGDMVAYGSISASQWLVGDNYGVILDGTSPATQLRYLTLGTPWSIAGGTAHFAIATAVGKIFYFDTTTNALAGTITDASALLSASSTGDVLAALADFHGASSGLGLPSGTDQTLFVYSLPSGAVIQSFPYTYGANPRQPLSLALSGSGTVLAIEGDASGCGWRTIPVSGGAAIYCDSGNHRSLQLSPDATLTSLTGGGSGPGAAAYSTNIVKNGVLTTAVEGLGIGWLDNGRLLAQNFTNSALNSTYLNSVIYDSSGKILATPALPQLPQNPPANDAQVLSPWMSRTADADTLYAPRLNEILSLTTGQPTWASADSSAGVGAIAGRQVVFVSGTLVLAQPY
jgi:hypothetical protein